MRVVQSSDWRDEIPFDVPAPAAEAAPGAPTRCFTCGVAGDPLPRTELWVVKHRHPNHHAGYVRFYCSAHTPAAPAPPAVVAPVRPARSSKPRAPRAEAPVRRPAPSDTVRAMCPDCFVEVSATGECGMCGRQVA